MRAEDLTIFDYRKEKCIKMTDLVQKERLEGRFEKGSVRTQSAGYIDFSIYRPSSWDPKEAAITPVIFNFHGGGFVLGFYEQDGKYCQLLADLTGCSVINVDYALAPEFKYPIPILSSYEALVEIMGHAKEYSLDTDSVFVCGHSAGGAIAADMCLLNREKKLLNIKGQILDYAPLHQSLSEEDRKALDPSKAIKHSRALQYINWYFEDLSQISEDLASPVNADLHDLPDMLVISAQYDSLAGKEKEFAEKAKKSGVQVQYEMFENCCHGFTHEAFSEFNPAQSERAWNMMAAFVNARK